METFIEELSSKKVLSKDDIILLKQYIAKKYAKYTKSSNPMFYLEQFIKL